MREKKRRERKNLTGLTEEWNIQTDDFLEWNTKNTREHRKDEENKLLKRSQKIKFFTQNYKYLEQTG